MHLSYHKPGRRERAVFGPIVSHSYGCVTELIPLIRQSCLKPCFEILLLSCGASARMTYRPIFRTSASIIVLLLNPVPVVSDPEAFDLCRVCFGDEIVSPLPALVRAFTLATFRHRAAHSFAISAGFSIAQSGQSVIEPTGEKRRCCRHEEHYCWPNTLDPKEYNEYRVGERDYNEISPHELKNVLCYALQQHGGPMDRDDLIKEASVLMGYNRLGKNLEAVLSAALQFAKSNGDVTGTDDIALKS